MGFTIGTPINYLMMSLVNGDEVSIGQSTVSLFKSIGVAISPNLLVNFVSDAGQKVPNEIAKVLPKLPTMTNPMSNASSDTFTMSDELIASFKLQMLLQYFLLLKIL